MKLLLKFAVVFVAISSAAEARQWIAVVAPEFQKAIAPLAEQRAKEGWKVTTLAAAGERTGLLKSVADLVKEDSDCVLLLVGDFAEAPSGTAVAPGQGTQARMKGKPSDQPWSVLDGALDKPIPVGRLPARTPEELTIMEQKILSWPEHGRQASVFPEARLILGNHDVSGPFGGLADALMNRMALLTIRKLPALWQMEAVVHVNDSPWQIYFGDLHDASHALMSTPATFLAYMGHSARDGAESANKRLLMLQEWRGLPAGDPRVGLFFSCGCHTCDFDPSEEAFGVAAMRAPGGPASVIGSQGETFAALGFLAMNGMLQAMAADPPAKSLGEMWLGVKQGLADGKIEPADFQMLDMGDGTSGKVPLETQRLEHLESWMLLGDPAMPLVPEPLPIHLEATVPPVAGGQFEVTGELPPAAAGAKVTVTLERQPATIRADLPTPPPSGEPRREATRKRRELSNDPVISSKESTAEGTSFKVFLTVPEALPAGPWIVRAVAHEANAAAGGVVVIGKN